jgi:MFS transporter, SP family, arabinose:H+ symporter
LIGRFLSGIVAGVGVSIPPLFINETVPVEIRGKLGSLIQFQVTFGIFVSFLLCIMLPVYRFDSSTNYLWIFVYGFPIVPATIQLILLYTVFPFDSAKYLAKAGNEKDLSKLLTIVYGPSHEHAKASLLAEVEKLKESEESHHDPSFQELFASKRYRKPLLVGCGLSLLQQFCGINTFIYYSSTIYEQIQGNKNFANMFTSALGFVNMAATVICVLNIEKYGRKLLLMQGCIGMGVCHLCLSLFNLLDVTAAGSLPFMLLFVVFFESSLGPVLWIYCGDTLTDRGVGLAVAMNWVGTIIITACFGFYAEFIGIGYAFLTFAAICFFGFFYVFVFIKETKGKTRDEIERLIG